MAYSQLSSDGKLELAIDFVARNQPVPDALKEFLVQAGLYDQVTNPGYVEEEKYIGHIRKSNTANLK
jgi:hypothetical protein